MTTVPKSTNTSSTSVELPQGMNVWDWQEEREQEEYRVKAGT